jgi:hypothetical protein
MNPETKHQLRFDNSNRRTVRDAAVPRFVLICVAVTLAFPFALCAQTNFTRISGGNWSTAASWSPLGVPGPADSATIIGAFDLNLDTSVTVSNLTVSLGANTLFSDGTRALTVLYSGNWSGGTISNMKLTLDAACSFSFAGGTKTLGSGGVITNAGTVTWTAGQFNLDNNQTFYNLPGALFEVQFDGTMIQNVGGTSIFRNEGTYRKSAGSGTNTIQIVSFINTGTAVVSNGVIRFAATALTATGAGNTFFAESGASLLFNQANNFTNSSFSGPGFKYVTTGAAEALFSGNIAATNLVFTAGLWRGAATLNGTLEWAGGTLSPQLTIPVGSTLRLSGNAAKTLGNGGVITNAGTVIWTAGQFNLDNNQTFYNQAGALFEVQFDGTMIQNVGGTSIFRNEGTYRKSDGTGTNTINIVSFVQLGHLEFLTGVIRLVGNHSLGGSSTLKTLIGGTTAGTQFGQIQVSGSVVLAGTLGLGLTNGFVPNTNQTFQIITAGSRNGVFAGTTGSALGNGLYFTPAYLANGVRLDVVDGTARMTNAAVINGRFQLQLLGTVGGRYQIDASTNLTNWASISTNLIPGSGFTNFIDVDSVLFPRRFYRALFLP